MKRGILPCIIFALLDFVYVLSMAAVLSVFVYWQNNGVIRAFILIPCTLGFVLYHNTVGRAVMYFSEAVVRFIRLVFRYTVAIPVRFVLGIIRRIVRFVYTSTLGRIIFVSAEAVDGMRTARYLRKLEDDIRLDRIPKIRRKEKK